MTMTMGPGPGPVTSPYQDEWASIAATITAWRQARNPLIEAAMQVQERYNGDWVLPDLGLEGKPLIPTVVPDAIDHLAQRACSVEPMIFCPALDPAATGDRAGSPIRAARRRQMVGYSLWKSRWLLGKRRATRHLVGYATTSLMVMPNFEHECMELVVRDPLHTIPEPKSPEDLSPPRACAYVYGKSAKWLLDVYPEAAPLIGVRGVKDAMGRPFIWDIAEYVDERSIWIGLLGPREPNEWRPMHETLMPWHLRTWENPIGRCTAIQPELVTMDRIGSQVSKITGQADLMARFTAMAVMAEEKALVPDRYIMSRQGRTARLVGGVWKDGRTGEVNILEDAEGVGELRGTVNPGTHQLIDRTERNARVSSGQTPQMIGESYGSMRSGRQIDAIMATATDPFIQELHEILQVRESEAAELLLEGTNTYWPTKKYHVFSGWPTDQAFVDYRPERDGETTIAVVQYPLPGADIQGLTIAVGQLDAAGMIPKKQARIMHPWVRTDPDQVERELRLEQADDLIFTALAQRAADPQGGVTPEDWALFKRGLREGKELEDVLVEMQRAAQERQAAAAPPPPEGMAMSPELMPGVANPGEGAEMQPPPSVPPPMPAIENVRRIASAYTGAAPGGG